MHRRKVNPFSFFGIIDYRQAGLRKNVVNRRKSNEFVELFFGRS